MREMIHFQLLLYTLTTFAFGKVPKMALALSDQWRGN